jgi:hypothetical protein
MLSRARGGHTQVGWADRVMGEMLHLRPSGGGGGGGGVQCLVRALVRLPQLEDDGRPSDALCAACSGATALQTAVSGHITPIIAAAAAAAAAARCAPITSCVPG